MIAGSGDGVGGQGQRLLPAGAGGKDDLRTGLLGSQWFMGCGFQIGQRKCMASRRFVRGETFASTCSPDTR